MEGEGKSEVWTAEQFLQILYFRPTNATLIAFPFLTKYTIIPFQNKLVRAYDTLTAYKLISWVMGITSMGR